MVSLSQEAHQQGEEMELASSFDAYKINMKEHAFVTIPSCLEGHQRSFSNGL